MRWLSLLALLPVFAAPEPAAKVTGPIPVTATPGDRSHNYPYFSARDIIAPFDYVEEEFYVEGLAVQYNASVAPGGPYAYKTRVIVRRPKSAAKFNGSVILEWMNATLGTDKELDWYWSHEHLMRRGFAHVGASVQALGIEHETRGLKAWNRARYGSLNVTAGGMFTADELSFSIYTQIAQALKQPSGSGLLGNLKVRNLVATGHSQAAGRLVIYYNSIHPANNVVDGFVLHGPAASGELRTDLRTPAWKLLAESDVARGQAAARQPDTEFLRTWEAAGVSHGDLDVDRVYSKLLARDLSQAEAAQPVCDRPLGSAIPGRLIQDAVYDWIKQWIERGTQPPHAPRIEISSISRVKGTPSTVVRDGNGNALGGIRLALFAVPVATDSGLNSGADPGCRILGSHEPFDAAKLSRLYPSHARYVAEVDRITDENLKAGYITKEGAAWTRSEARRASVGR